MGRRRNENPREDGSRRINLLAAACLLAFACVVVALGLFQRSKALTVAGAACPTAQPGKSCANRASGLITIIAEPFTKNTVSLIGAPVSIRYPVDGRRKACTARGVIRALRVIPRSSEMRLLLAPPVVEPLHEVPITAIDVSIEDFEAGCEAAAIRGSTPVRLAVRPHPESMLALLINTMLRH
jgi:hypothetical protein